MRPTVACFHHAGGSSIAYRDWGAEHGLKTHAVCLPGRDERRSEVCPGTMSELVEQLDGELSDVLDDVHVMFGHSMGGTIAYELLRRRLERGARLPEALIVAASNPPQLTPAGLPLDSMSDLEIAEALSELGGIPRALLERPEWLGPLLGPVKHDLRLCRSARLVTDRDLVELPVPLHVIAGSQDRLAPPDRLGEWRVHSAGEFTLSVVDAGHFLALDHRTEVSAIVASIVDDTRVATS